MIVTVCIGSSCHLKGSREIIEKLQHLLHENKLEKEVELRGSFCMGECMNGVCVKIEEELFSLSPAAVEEFFLEQILKRLT
ncbi:Thioredoxin-like [2Fe-2S] ferredoxin [Anaerosporobacter mobilis DSM 15930]|jgi:NADH:ubiquinone oxidoreductase subunit E|uniref:Thioredoxin-like [2Fe-2S] ferredoxin n=1 Tax=Anaerosporobacter mobilis DSM 15930 TaxID=1120996 RepID=A0A1M7FY63_9FIRM|nr:NAD(P)H-dependent oxidoreductase subunit E [Anaerosporobacter mobilis]SHM08768.1 Thioredoxin-like [2Fe-2S] ferredoxin [Anaerosporobacter mobilis DSM 15930]